MPTIENEEAPRRSLPARILRFPIKLIVMLVVLLVRPFVRHPRFSAVAAVIGVVALYSTMTTLGLSLKPTSSPPQSTPATSAESIVVDGDSPRLTTQSPLASPQSPVAYIRAQSKNDVHTMWLQLSNDVQVREGSEQKFQQKISSSRTTANVKEIMYVGGMKMRDGNGVYMYVLTVESDGEVAQSPITVYLDPNGKIRKVE